MSRGKRRVWQIHLSTIMVLVPLLGLWLSLNSIVQPIDGSLTPTFGMGFPALFYYHAENPSSLRMYTGLGQPTLGEMLQSEGRNWVDPFWLCLDLICAAIVFFIAGSICEYVNRRHT